MGMGLLFDATRCIGCGACSSACKEQNKLPGPVEEQLTAYTWTTVQPKEGLNVRRMCMHCEVPTCASVCPVAALQKTPEGPVVYDAKRCMGCRYCMMACPFEIPKYQWDRPVPVVGKCIMCAGRLKEGKPTACAEACPAEATIFGKREDLIWEARTRLREKHGSRRHLGAGAVQRALPQAGPEVQPAGGSAGHAHLAGAVEHPRLRGGVGRPALWRALDHGAPRRGGQG